ncbi:replication protein A 70 kDa DNA-binding subunit B [Tanacetum coccineum]
MKLTIRVVSISCCGIRRTTGYRLPLLPHKYKISFYKSTTVTRIDLIDDNLHGFILEPFNRLLDGARVYHKHEAVDVIGSVVAIGDVVPVQSSAGRKIRMTVVIEDVELDEYDQKRNELGHVVFILQLGKVKYWNGAHAIHNALFSTKMFINRDIHKESGWAYTACKQCNKKVNVVETKATTSSGKSKVRFYCKDDGAVLVTSSFKVIMRIIDLSSSAPIVFFNTVFNKISGHTAWEFMEKHSMDVDEYWPQELDELVGKRFLFKLWYSDYNVNNNNHTYHCDAFNNDADMIKHFKVGFMDEEGFTTPANRIKSVAFNESSITRVLDLHTPPSAMEASGSGLSSGGDKKRVFIDLDSIESEDEEASGSSKTPKLITVKIEKEN